MRLIDADALIDWIDAGHLRSPSERCFSEQTVVDMIDHMPTIEPDRDTSHWIPLDTYMGQERYKCAECGEITKDTIMGKPRPRYCPWCGRKMM